MEQLDDELSTLFLVFLFSALQTHLLFRWGNYSVKHYVKDVTEFGQFSQKPHAERKAVKPAALPACTPHC